MKNYFYTNCYQKGNKIYLKGYANGKRFKDDYPYEPFLFVPGKGEYKTIFDEPLKKVDFKNIKDAKEFIEMYSSASNAKFYGLTNFTFTFLNSEFPGKVDFNPSLISIVSLDIEVSSKNGMPDINEATEEVTAITLVRNKKTFTFGTKVYYGENPYVYCDTEKGMLELFLHYLNDEDSIFCPDVITGWSVDLFDIPYLINRVRRLLGEEATKRFSPLGIAPYTRTITRAKTMMQSAKEAKDARSRQDIVYEIPGLTVLDYLQLYKKFSPISQESYALNHIAKVELGRGKHDYSDVGTLDDLYEKAFDRYIDYNVEDAILVEEIETKKQYLQIIFSIAYKAKINYIDAMTTSRPWDAIIHNYLLAKKIAVPQTKEPPKNVEFPGGYVKEPQVGLHKWVVSFDFDSLYPTIASQQNISPETFVDKFELPSVEILSNSAMNTIIDHDKCVTANGCRFRKDIRGFIPELVDIFVSDRTEIKRQMVQLKKDDPKSPLIESLDHYQQALKILNNGLYGSLGQKHFRWFEVYFAEAITTTAQVCTRYVEIKVNEYLNRVLKTEGIDYVIACDTDSVYINLGVLVKEVGLQGKSTGDVIEFVDTICKSKIQPLIERCCMELCNTFNAYEPKLKMKREAIAEKGIWRAAKQYILNIWDLEGVRFDEPQLKYKGIEVVRSSTPMICRDNLKKCLSIIMNKDEKTLQKFVKSFHTEFMKMPFEIIAFPRSVNAALEEYSDPISLCKKGTPIHMRGSLVYNDLIDKKDLEKLYPKIRNKDKIRFAYLKEPNPVFSHVIAAPDELPKELGLEEYVDYNMQWDRSFRSPIKSITDVIGWKMEKTATLEALF